MPSQYLGNDPSTALQIAKKLYPNEAHFEVLGQGQENLVIVAGQTYSVRFPRSEGVWQRGQAERTVLAALTPLALPSPKLLSVSENPAYIQTTYLKGNHLDANEIRKAPEAIRQQIGKEIATFAFKLHRVLSVEKITPLLVPPTWSYDDYLKRVLFERKDLNPKIDALAKHYYNAWLHRKAEPKDIIVHDDLHTGNLLFDDNYRLTGVLDFGAVCLGTAEQDLRQIYRFGNTALEAAAAIYEELSGQPIDREIAKLWLVTQELGAYCREAIGVAHDRAAENLQFWFPELF